MNASCKNAQKDGKKIGDIDDKVIVCPEVLPTKLRYHSFEIWHFVLYNRDIENKGSAKKHSVNIPKPEAKRKTETGIKPMGRGKKERRYVT